MKVVKIKYDGTPKAYISFLKAIRLFSDCSLKEARDMAEPFRSNFHTFTPFVFRLETNFSLKKITDIINSNEENNEGYFASISSYGFTFEVEDKDAELLYFKYLLTDAIEKENVEKAEIVFEAWKKLLLLENSLL